MVVAFSLARSAGASKPWLPRAALALLVLAVVLLIWWGAGQQGTMTRKAQESVLVPIIPPEVVPPPPVEERVEPEPVPEEVPPVPVDQPQPVTPNQPSDAAPSETPSAAPGNNALSINGPAQAGADSFGIGAGDGSGSRGSGGRGGGLGRFNRGAYAAYLQSEIARIVRGDAKLRSQPIRVKARIWIDSAGRIGRAEIGEMLNGPKLQSLLLGRTVRVPDATLEMPVLFTLDIARSE